MTNNIIYPQKELFFDINNPRLVEFGLNERSKEDDIISILWNAMDAKEIAMSIVASGYFQNDPLIVAIENSKHVVIEGNRRLAAVRVLTDSAHFEKIISNIPPITTDAVDALKSLPIVIQGREEAWKFLGFKHVNGPAKWGSYAKAKYISEVHKLYDVPLEQIGRQIGDTNQTVQRLYRGLMVIEQAEREKIFSRDDIVKKSFAFSHIYVGLQREGIQQFLNIDESNEESDKPVPVSNLGHLKDLLLWIYGSRKDNIEPVVQSQNPHLKQLDQVLQKRAALVALKAGSTLEEALELTKPASSVFEEELIAAKRSLVKARGLLSEGYDKSDELLRIAGSIATIADDLYEEMLRKTSPEKKTRIVEKD